eukprot:COSAG01_NODE_18578_length_1066_cov_24.381593_2_plen_163_part_00
MTRGRFQTDLACVPTIFLEFRGQTVSSCKLDADSSCDICYAHGATDCKVTEDGTEMDEMWAARRGCYIAAGKVREQKGDSVYLSDTCVPISKVSLPLGKIRLASVTGGGWGVGSANCRHKTALWMAAKACAAAPCFPLPLDISWQSLSPRLRRISCPTASPR